MLQRIFIGDWNFCAAKKLEITDDYFPVIPSQLPALSKRIQIVSSGPDSDRPTIYFAIINAIQAAKTEICFATPYFIPGETIIDTMKIAALSGVEVKLLVAQLSDSFLGNAAARSYYSLLLKAGVRIFRYEKGFMHAKTMIVDRGLAMIGTANLDQRSFDLNFEVNAVVYDESTVAELRNHFAEDLRNSTEIHIDSWLKRPLFTQLFEKIARLLSPLL